MAFIHRPRSKIDAPLPPEFVHFLWEWKEGGVRDEDAEWE